MVDILRGSPQALPSVSTLDNEIEIKGSDQGIEDKSTERDSSTIKCGHKRPLDEKDNYGQREEEIMSLPQKTKGDPKRVLTEKLVVGRDCNAQIIADTHTKEALLIDPGGEPKMIDEWVRKLGVKVVQILVTHAHFDHILAADKVRRALKCPVWLHSKDLSLWRQLPEQMAILGLKRRGTRCVKRLADPDFFLEDGDKLKILGGVTIHTPGHTPGSVCFYFPAYDLLISGDTLFKAHVGRTDLPGGDAAALRRSVFHKLYKLPFETRVLPGHGKETTIGYEMENNRSCRVCTCKAKRSKESIERKHQEESGHSHAKGCPATGQHIHSSGGNHSETHTSTSETGCCDEAEEGDEACTCGAAKIPGKHQHVGKTDACSVL